MNQPLITVIIPVYNTSEYLAQCVRSVCTQTLRDIAVVLIDDGSTDGSGALCNRFAEEDPRVKVFHTENRGHYLARNIGLEEARRNGSSHIGFVDSDDWVDPGMFGALLDRALETGADITECGWRVEYPDRSDEWLPAEGVFGTRDALYELFRGKAHDYFWNKLWKVSCFDGFSFPAAQAYTDMIITYRLVARAGSVAGVGKAYYHDRQTDRSIVYQHDMRLLTMWTSNLEKYEYIRTVMSSRLEPDRYAIIEGDQLLKCVTSAAKNWAWWNGNPKEEREKHRGEPGRMAAFLREHVPPAGRRGWSPRIRAFCLAGRFPGRLTLALAWQVNRLARMFRKSPLAQRGEGAADRRAAECGR